MVNWSLALHQGILRLKKSLWGSESYRILLGSVFDDLYVKELPIMKQKSRYLSSLFHVLISWTIIIYNKGKKEGLGLPHRGPVATSEWGFVSGFYVSRPTTAVQRCFFSFDRWSRSSRKKRAAATRAVISVAIAPIKPAIPWSHSMRLTPFADHSARRWGFSILSCPMNILSFVEVIEKVEMIKYYHHRKGVKRLLGRKQKALPDSYSIIPVKMNEIKRLIYS